MLGRLRGAALVGVLFAISSAGASAQELGSALTVSAGSASCLATNCVDVPAAGVAVIGIDVVNNGTYTLQVEALSASDGTTWRSVKALDKSDGSADSSITGPGSWAFPNDGILRFRIRASAYTSGSPVVTLTRGFVMPDQRFAGSVTATVASDGNTGAAVPSSASYFGVNIGGNLVGVTGVSVGSARAAAVAIVDGSGNQITAFGGGVQYTEGDVDSTITGTALMFEGAANTLIAAPGTAANGLLVDVSRVQGTVTISGAVTNTGTFAVQASIAAGATTIGKAEDAASADGDVGVPAMAVRRASPANSSGTDGDYEPLQMSAGRLWVDASGVTLTVGAHAVTNAGTFAVQADSIIPGTGATNLGKAEDAVANSGDVGVAMLAVRRDSATAAAADGDYVNLSTDSTGALRVVGSSGTTQYAEDVAHVSGDSMVFVGAIRRDTTPSSSSGTAGDYSAINVDANGRLYTNGAIYTPNGDSAMDDTADAVKVLLVNTSGTALSQDTQLTHDGALTVGSTTGGALFARASSTAPTNVSANDDAVLLWAMLSGALVNQPSYGGTLASTGNGNVGAGVARFAVAADNSGLAAWGHGAIGSAPPAGTTFAGGIKSGATGGLLSGITVCDLDKEIDVTANAVLVSGVSGRKIRICSMDISAFADTNVVFVTGTGSTCGTGTTKLSGGSTAATGWPLKAGGGLTRGSGVGEILTAHNTGDDLCILVSAANQVSGSIKYAVY